MGVEVPADARRGAPRILVIGTCQGVAVGRAMQLLLPEAHVETRSAFDLDRRFRRMADLVGEAKRHDLVFANAALPRFADGGDFETLRAAVPLIPIPTIVFGAFHPDLVYIGDALAPSPSDFLLGPIGHYHSALALFAYLEGWSPAKAERLFRADVYREVGYLDAWPDAADGLLTLGRHADFDLAPLLARWAQGGCFMHSANHPRTHVLCDLARGLLAKASLTPAGDDIDGYLPETLVDGGTWPVYRPIAEHYGIAWSDLFLKSRTRRTGPARTMTRLGFIEACFARYARYGRDRLSNDRVAHWRRSPERHALLTEAAGP